MPEEDEGSLVADNISIGYKIYLPKVEIKGVLVSVYGGNEAQDIDDNVGDTFIPINVAWHLLEKGISVVTLYLPDLLELKTRQFMMPKELHTKIHGSINKFFEILSTDPSALIQGQSMAEELSHLKGVKKYLYGASFGGRTVVRHAELYPGTFNGYISHDGGLSPAHGVKLWDLGNTAEWLSPMDVKIGLNESDQKINKIKDIILLLHNFDDNNVNVKESIFFYNQAKKDGKGDFIRLYITRRGNPTPKNIKSNKGHFITDDTNAFKSYKETISSFILNGPEIFKTRSDWMAHQYDIYGNKNIKDATLQERFISEAFRMYKTSYYPEVKDLGQKRIAKTHKEMLEDLKKKEALSSGKNPQEALENRKAIEIEIFDLDWITIYNPLYKLLVYVDSLKDAKQTISEIDKIFGPQGLDLKSELARPLLTNALMQQLPQFFQYLREIDPEKYYYLPYDMDEIRSFAMMKELHQSFIDIIKRAPIPGARYAPTIRSGLLKYMLYCFYKGNHELLEGIEIPVDPKDESDAKENLWLKIKEDKAYVLKRADELSPFFRERVTQKQ